MKRKLIGIILLTLAAGRHAHSFAVATPTPWATEAAVTTLKNGGNAMDAAVAATFALNVTQPFMMGIGGGGFLIASQDGTVTLWNHRETSPASVRATLFLQRNGQPIPAFPERMTGPNPVGVPGTVAGIYAAHQRLGSLPWKHLLQPAIRIARDGFPIPQKFAEMLALEWSRISAFPATASTFGDDSGRPLKAGGVLRQPLLAATFEAIADKGAAEFYTGALSRAWLAQARKLGVRITSRDLRQYRVRMDPPVRYQVFGLEAYSPSPPSASGIMVAGTLRFLEHYYATRARPPAHSALRVIVTSEALAYFQKLRNAMIADVPFSKLDPMKFLGSADEAAAWDAITAAITERLGRLRSRTSGRSTQGVTHRTETYSPGPEGHTAHISIVDDHGMAVSYTDTIEHLFGSGMVVPGHGFLLNNELSDFSAEPGLPNSPAPGKQPRSNMSPTLLMDGRRNIVGVVGCAGGGFIPTVIVETLENYYLHQMTARKALTSPRFQPDGDGKLKVEKTLPPATIAALRKAGYDLTVVDVFNGIAQVLLRRNATAGWEAVSEPRWDEGRSQLSAPKPGIK